MVDGSVGRACSVVMPGEAPDDGGPAVGNRLLGGAQRAGNTPGMRPAQIGCVLQRSRSVRIGGGTHMTALGTPAEVSAEVREGTYGARVVAVEPGGAGFIPLNERHGRPLNLFWTWMSPNLEFATIFVGVISVLYFEQTFWQAVAAIVVGTGLGALTHGFLSARGPSMGVPQMVLSRIGFGYRGNILPAGLIAVVAGIGWFAVNSVSGALALSTLTGLPSALCLIIVVALQVVIAFFGHNLVQTFERYAFP